MTVEFFIYLAIGSLASGFVNGLAGLGTALFAMGWWLQVMTPVEAVAVILVMSLVSGVQGMILVWKSIDWKLLGKFLIPALVGIPIGLRLLSYINSTILVTLIAAFLLIYGGFFSFRKHLPNLTRKTPVIDVSVGFIGGILGAVGGLSGVLPAMLCSMRPWSKMKQRAVLQPFNFIVMSLAATMLAFKGGYPISTIKIMAISFPITMIASFIGIQVFRRLNDDQFRRLLIIMMLLSGVILIVKEYFL